MRHKVKCFFLLYVKVYLKKRKMKENNRRCRCILSILLLYVFFFSLFCVFYTFWLYIILVYIFLFVDIQCYVRWNTGSGPRNCELIFGSSLVLYFWGLNWWHDSSWQVGASKDILWRSTCTYLLCTQWMYTGYYSVIPVRPVHVLLCSVPPFWLQRSTCWIQSFCKQL